jgi:hypothetical protein
MTESGNHQGSPQADLDMRTHFCRDVEEFISSSVDPKWNEFLKLIDELIVRSSGRSSNSHPSYIRPCH